MTALQRATARDLAQELEHRRSRQPVGNALLDQAGNGDLTEEHLKRLLGIDAQCHTAELAAYGTMLARFPHRPAADLYLQYGRLVYDLRPALDRCARAFAMTIGQLERWPSTRATYAFTSTLSWVALRGSQAAGALALYTDMTVYFSACGELVAHLRTNGARVPVEFLDYYGGDIDDNLRNLALEVTQDGLDRGDDPDEAVHYARLVEEAFTDYWHAAADKGSVR